MDGKHDEAGRPNLAEREFETGMDEAYKLNMKMIVDKMFHDGHTADAALKNVALQAVQNAVETANMVSKDALRDRALATDRLWNVDEVAHLVVNTSVFKDAIAGAVAAAVAETLAAKK